MDGDIGMPIARRICGVCILLSKQRAVEQSNRRWTGQDDQHRREDEEHQRKGELDRRLGGLFFRRLLAGDSQRFCVDAQC